MVRIPSSEWYSPETRIMLITPPPVSLRQMLKCLREFPLPVPGPGNSTGLGHTLELTNSYAVATLEVGKEEGVPVLDIFTHFWEECDQDERKMERYLVDGMHLNEDAHKAVYRELDKAIMQHFPEIHHSNLEPVYPIWFGITHANYKSVLKNRSMRYKNKAYETTDCWLGLQAM